MGSLSLSFWSLNNSPLPLPLRGRKRKQRRVAEVGDQGGWRHLEGAKKRLRKFLRRRFFSPPTRPLPRRGKKRVKSESEREERRTTTRARARALQNSSFSLALSLAFLLFLSFSARCFGAHPLYPCLAQSSRPERPWRRREDGKRGGNQNFRLIIDQSTSKKKSKPWPLPSSSAESAPRCHSRTSSTWPQVREKKKMGKE